MKNTHGEGGSREAQDLYEHLMVTGTVPAGRLLLVDDVLTGGGHMAAVAYVLKRAGVQVEHGLCAAKADQACPEYCFRPTIHSVDDFVPIADDDVWF
jgi:adenine/guanine phosphoribosyltransferase-like PRPP-binding protein